MIVPTVSVPLAPDQKLPSTGIGVSSWLVLGAAAMSLVGVVLTRRRSLSNR